MNLRNGPEAPLGVYEYIEHLFPSSEKKPFRLWIQVSENDNGSKTPSEGRRNWVIANSRLAKVLKDKGYAYQFVYSKGAGHTAESDRQYSAAGAGVCLARLHTAAMTGLRATKFGWFA